MHHKYLVLFGLGIFGLSCGSKPDQSSQVLTERSAQSVAPPKDEKEGATIIFYGNSLTAGYGLDETKAFPALIQKRLDSLKLPYTVVNAGLSGETSAGGLSRIDWILNQPVQVFVLELGANDALRGLDPTQTKANLQGIIDKVYEKNAAIKIVLAGMKAPPNMGSEYTSEFDSYLPTAQRGE